MPKRISKSSPKVFERGVRGENHRRERNRSFPTVVSTVPQSIQIIRTNNEISDRLRRHS